MKNIEIAIKELYRLFEELNKKIYKNELPEPAILIQNQGKHKGTLGWCTTKEIWADKENTIKKYEITMCAEYLNRNIHEIAGTMLHEMVHLDNIRDGVKDCTRAGKYHNKKFKAAAEAAGLIVELSDLYGWSQTKLSPDLIQWIKTLNINLNGFKLARSFELAKKGTKKSSTRKYQCPYCENTVRATKDVNIICKDCGCEYIKISED